VKVSHVVTNLLHDVLMDNLEIALTAFGQLWLLAEVVNNAGFCLVMSTLDL